jgi:hypothetical protein
MDIPHVLKVVQPHAGEIWRLRGAFSVVMTINVGFDRRITPRDLWIPHTEDPDK